MNSAAQIIAAEIKNRGIIPFARFMELALYCPVYGFYEAEGDKIGRGGDFYTSVSVGPVFGQLLACQIAQWRQGCPGPQTIVEAGAHRGDLTRDILRWLRDFEPDLFARTVYLIVEPSPMRKSWQEATLREFAGHVQWATTLDDLAATPQSPQVPPCGTPGSPGRAGSPAIQGVILSNELLDAMPVHRFGWDAAAQQWYEWGVTLDKKGFAWAPLDLGKPVPLEPPQPVPKHQPPAEHDWAAALLSALTDAAGRGEHCLVPGEAWREAEELFSVLPDGFVVEVCPAARRWWSQAAELLQHGHLLTFDYGCLAHDLFVPERTGGTLRAFRRHTASSDLLINPGDQDLTAHVNFSEIQSAGEAAGLHTEAFTTQEQFLTKLVANAWPKANAFGAETKSWTRQFQTLTNPQHLGRAFRVLIQRRPRGAD